MQGDPRWYSIDSKNKVVEVVEEPKPRPEVAADLVSLQEEISSRPTEIVDLPIETLVDLPVEPARKLISSLVGMRASVFLRSPDKYDPLKICLHETGS